MIRKAQRLGRLRDVPVVFVERGEHDLSLGLCFQRLERPGWRRLGAIVALIALKFRRHIRCVDRLLVRRNNHSLEAVS